MGRREARSCEKASHAPIITLGSALKDNNHV